MKSSRVLLWLAFGLSPALVLALSPNAYRGGRSRSAADRNARNSSAIAVMLGEFRTSMSDLLFVKTERYLDSGIAYMPHIDDHLASVQAETAELAEHHHDAEHGHAEAAGHVHGPDCGHGHDHDHADGAPHAEGEFAGTPTIIRTPEDDFRGFIGWLHREVKPWRDPRLGHEHTDGTELLPWYRMMTMADPHNIRGYAIGAWWLTDHSPEEAVRFASEGVENNPEAFQLHLILGRVLYAQANAILADTGAGQTQIAPIIDRAIASFRRGAELAIAQRPPGGYLDPGDSGWDESLEEDALASARMAVLLLESHGDPAEARRLASDYTHVFGVDYVLERHAAAPVSPEPHH